MLTLTDDKLLKFVLILGKSCVAFVWGEKLGWPRTLFIILLKQFSFSNVVASSGNPLAVLNTTVLYFKLSSAVWKVLTASFEVVVS